MQRLADRVEHRLVPLVLAAAGIGLTLPGPGRWVAERDGINLVLAVLVLAAGLLVGPGLLAQARATQLPRGRGCRA